MAKKTAGVDIVREVLDVSKSLDYPASVEVQVRLQANEQRTIILSKRKAQALFHALAAEVE